MLRKICNVLIALVILCALALIAVLGIPLVMNNALYAVQTASMEPTYPVGSVVIVQPTSAEEIAVGDVVTYNASGFDTKVTHRVIRVDAENRLFYTKGDNNANEDFYPVPFESVEGRVTRMIPYLGHVVANIRTPGGILVLLWVVLIVVVLLLLPDLLDKRKKIKEEAAEEAAQSKKPRAINMPATAAAAPAQKQQWQRELLRDIAQEPATAPPPATTHRTAQGAPLAQAAPYTAAAKAPGAQPTQPARATGGVAAKPAAGAGHRPYAPQLTPRPMQNNRPDGASKAGAAAQPQPAQSRVYRAGAQVQHPAAQSSGTAKMNAALYGKGGL